MSVFLLILAALTHYIRVEQGRSGFRTYEAPEEVVEEIIPEGGEVIEEVNFIEEPVFNPRAAEGGSVVEALTANNHRQYQG